MPHGKFSEPFELRVGCAVCGGDSFLLAFLLVFAKIAVL
jgi:hypothetical protein